MNELQEYRRRDGTMVTAVQLNLDMDGLTYRKWGGVQTAAPGDWLVNLGGEAHTVEREVFERTYSMVSLGVYEKVTSVWAIRADSDGVIATKEGETHYVAGDMLVYNDRERQDGYAVGAKAFEELYELLAASDD